ncbi:MAG: ShlB/FhaC/HecB family hemolysin secretion/activation protein [Roseimicrobium sp.]
MGLALLLGQAHAASEAAPAAAPAAEAPATQEGESSAPLPSLYIREYRVQGSKLLSAGEIGEAVYPFLGPARTTEDIEQARAALEKAYHEKGFQAVTVEVPQQSGKRGIIVLRAVENTVGRLRVRGARYFLPSDIKRLAPSLAEGKVPNFNDVTKDIVGLQGADRQVTPSVRAGIVPGTVDVDLTVKDNLPLHGSIELNNRYSPDTTPLRLNASISYGNLWQKGHSIGASYQVAPERPEDATVYSGYYITRVPWLEDLSLMFMGTKQDSDVSTLGGAAVVGRGEILGLRALITLPPLGNYYQSLSLGVDWKHFEENVVVGAETFSTPIQYWPISVNYGGSWVREHSFTEFNTNVTFHLRGTGAEPVEFDNKRYLADGAFIYLRGDVSHQQDLPAGFRLYGKIQGQVADSPLINSEQYAGGGLSTVRGYLESTAMGDNGVFGTVELHSPSFIGTDREERGERVNEWRIYSFLEGGRLQMYEPLAEQESVFDLASWGIGSRMRLFGHLNGSVDIAWPLLDQGTTKKDEMFVNFRVWTDF